MTYSLIQRRNPTHFHLPHRFSSPTEVLPHEVSIEMGLIKAPLHSIRNFPRTMVAKQCHRIGFCKIEFDDDDDDDVEKSSSDTPKFRIRFRPCPFVYMLQLRQEEIRTPKDFPTNCTFPNVTVLHNHTDAGRALIEATEIKLKTMVIECGASKLGAAAPFLCFLTHGKYASSLHPFRPSSLCLCIS